MDHFVKLDRLPDGLDIPSDLKERIYFDAAGHRLVCRGYMSKGDFDRLSQLTKDWGFRRTLEDLFRVSVMGEGERPRGARRLLSVFGRVFTLG